MIYLILKVVKRIKNNIKQYTFIFLQVFIGILIMTVFLSINMSINKDYKAIKSKTESNLIKLNFLSQQNNDPKDDIMKTPFDLNDYRILEKKYSNKVKISYLTKKDVNYITTNNGVSDISTVSMLFATDEFFQLYYPKANVSNFESKKIVFIGIKALEVMENGVVAGDNVKIHKEIILPNKLILDNGDDLKIVNANAENGFDNRQIILDIYSNSLKMDIEDVIIVPAKYLPIFKIQSDEINTFVSLKLINSGSFADVGIGIINYLYSKNKDMFDYSFDTLTEEYQRQTNGYKICAIGLTILSAFVMLIIIMGLTGIFLIMVNRRIGEYAISMTLGATKSKIILETMLESVIVTLLGGVTGIFSSIYLLKYILKFRQFNIYIDNKLLLFSLVVSIFIGVISALLPILRIKQIAPIEIIRSL